MWKVVFAVQRKLFSTVGNNWNHRLRVIRNVYYYFKWEQRSHSFVKTTSDATGVSAQSRGLLPQIKFVRHQEKKGDRSENGSSSKSTTSLWMWFGAPFIASVKSGSCLLQVWCTIDWLIEPAGQNTFSPTNEHGCIKSWQVLGFRYKIDKRKVMMESPRILILR